MCTCRIFDILKILQNSGTRGLPSDVKDTLTESCITADTHTGLAIVFYVTEEAQLGPPLGRREVVQGNTPKDTRFNILYSGSI